MTPLNNIKARDIMRMKVVTFAPSTLISSAIETFEDLHISGAPVVDERGVVVGMLSAFDIAKAEHVQNDAIRTERGDFDVSGLDEDEPFGFDEVVLSMSDYSPGITGRTTVSEWMSREVVSVGPDCGLRTLCRLMVKEHVHRLPVIKNGKLVGIISTLDIVRCLSGDLPVVEPEPAARRAVDPKGKKDHMAEIRATAGDHARKRAASANADKALAPKSGRK